MSFGVVVLTWVSLSICQIWRIFKAPLSLLKAAGNSECSFSLCRANGYTSHMQTWPYNNYDINDNLYLLSQSFSIHLPQSLPVRFLLITTFSLFLLPIMCISLIVLLTVGHFYFFVFEFVSSVLHLLFSLSLWLVFFLSYRKVISLPTLLFYHTWSPSCVSLFSLVSFLSQELFLLFKYICWYFLFRCFLFSLTCFSLLTQFPDLRCLPFLALNA